MNKEQLNRYTLMLCVGVEWDNTVHKCITSIGKVYLFDN